MTMTYYSSTFSSTASNPPILLAEGIATPSTLTEPGTIGDSKGWLHGNHIWMYGSTNLPSDIITGTTAGFTDGRALGMRAGDIVLGVTASGGSTTAIPWIGVIVCSAGSTDPGGIVSSAVGGILASTYCT